MTVTIAWGSKANTAHCVHFSSGSEWKMLDPNHRSRLDLGSCCSVGACLGLQFEAFFPPLIGGREGG